MRLAALLTAALTLVACDEKERAARSEAAAVSRAIDGVRAADNAQKSGPLAALRDSACTVPDVCALKSFCVAAYEKHVAVLGLLAEAKATVATAPAASVAALVKSAEEGLGQAKSSTDECATRQGELGRRYRVAR